MYLFFRNFNSKIYSFKSFDLNFMCELKIDMKTR